MAVSGGITASLAGRYALALYTLAQDANAITAVEADLLTVRAAIADSADLARLIRDPLAGRDETVRAVAAIAGVLGLSPLATNFLGVVAGNRRLASLAAIIDAFSLIAADARGEVTAQVITAHPLDDAQLAAIAEKLAAREGRTVTIEPKVDPAILGGLVVKIGSQMIDSSIRTRLNSLAQAMQG